MENMEIVIRDDFDEFENGKESFDLFVNTLDYYSNMMKMLAEKYSMNWGYQSYQSSGYSGNLFFFLPKTNVCIETEHWKICAEINKDKIKITHTEAKPNYLMNILTLDEMYNVTKELNDNLNSIELIFYEEFPYIKKQVKNYLEKNMKKIDNCLIEIYE